MKKLSHTEKSIHDVKSWPPGEFILIDQREEWKRMGSPASLKPHVGLGMVVANDGKNQIRVLWGSNCSSQYVEYRVDRLNPVVIYHVG